MGVDESPRQVRDPVFVVAAPRSLSSLLCAMLGQHPEAYATPGTHLLTHPTVRAWLEQNRGRRQNFQHGLLRTVAQLYAGDQSVEAIEMARRWLGRRLDTPTHEVQRELCRKVAPRRLIERCPIHSRRQDALERLQDFFPEASFIYVVRHPVEQGIAMLQDPAGITELLLTRSVDYAAKPPALDPQFAWFETQSLILAFLDSIPAERQFHLRAEDLLAEPSETLRKLCGWLDFPCSEELLERMLRVEDSPFLSAGPYNAPIGFDPGVRRLVPLRPQAQALPSLETALPWRRDNAGLAPQVAELAGALGY
jgi:hypothetical protein